MKRRLGIKRVTRKNGFERLIFRPSKGAPDRIAAGQQVRIDVDKSQPPRYYPTVVCVDGKFYVPLPGGGNLEPSI